MYGIIDDLEKMFGTNGSINVLKHTYAYMLLLQNKRYSREVLGKEIIEKPSFISRVAGMFNRKKNSVDKKEFDDDEER